MLRRCVAVLAFFAACSVACAADWTLSTPDVGARGFAGGEWSALIPGDPLTRYNLVEADARLHAVRDGDALDLGPNGEIKVEGDGLVRLFKGALGVTVAGSAEPILVMTTYAEIATAGATFGVVSESNGSTIAVRSGVVEIKELTAANTVAVKAGEVYRVRVGHIGAPGPAADDEPAMAAADGAPGDARLAAVPSHNRRPARIEALDLVPTGAIQWVGREASAKGEPNAARRSADPLIAKLEARAGRLNFQEAETLAPPWDARFQWTQVEDGQVRLKPLFQVIGGLDRPQALGFWFVAILMCVIWGAYAAQIEGWEEAGLAGNSAVVALSVLGAMVVRDAYLRDLVGWEPYLTISLLFGAPLLAQRGGSLGRLFALTPSYVPARTTYRASSATPAPTQYESRPIAARPAMRFRPLKARLAGLMARLFSTAPPSPKPDDDAASQ